MKKLVLLACSLAAVVLFCLGAGTVTYTAFFPNIQVYTNAIVGTVWIDGTGAVSMNYDSANINFGTTSDTTILRTSAGSLRVSTNLAAKGVISSDTMAATNGITAGASTFTGGLTVDSLNVGTVTFTNPPAPPVFTVSTLPAGPTGAPVWCTDVLTPWGTGDLLYYDGSSWKSYSSKIVAASSVPSFLLNSQQVGWSGTTPISIGRMFNFPSYATQEGLSTTQSGTGAGSVSLQYASPEVPFGWGIATGTATNGYCTTRSTPVVFKAGQYYLQSVRLALNNALPDGTDNYWVFIGIDGGANSIGASAIGFYYDPYNALGYGAALTNNWQCLTRASSSNTIADSGITATTGWITLSTLYNSTSVIFYVNSTSVATNIATIPTTGGLVTHRNGIIKTAGTNSRWIALDWNYSSMRLTAERTLY